MQLFGAGFMITFTEVATDLDDNFNEWYNREHLDERIDLPGFRRARRYESLDGRIRYMSTYECEDPGDIGSPTYLDVVAKSSPWSQQIMPNFTRWHRMVARVVADSTHGMGSYLTLARFFPAPSETAALETWLRSGVLDEIASRERVVGACAVAVVPEFDARLTRAFGQEPDPDQIPEWGVLIEGTDPDTIRTVAQDALAARLQNEAIAGTTPVFETYRFLYGNQRLSDTEKA